MNRAPTRRGKFSLESFSQKKDLIYLWPGKVPGELKEKQEGALQDAQRAIRIIRRWKSECPNQYGNSALVMAGALKDAKIPVELHILPFGGHGYGLRPGSMAGETWPLLAEKWLTRILQAKK